ncbi:hypothetical protein PTI98_007540 [Pleurotus ostreatus]|nr:hypothetical protein PTI98_007540 [Pleurotus ostreatus]
MQEPRPGNHNNNLVIDVALEFDPIDVPPVGHFFNVPWTSISVPLFVWCAFSLLSSKKNRIFVVPFSKFGTWQGWDQNNVSEYLIEMSAVTRLYVLAVGSITTSTVDSSYLGKFWRRCLTRT